MINTLKRAAKLWALLAAATFATAAPGFAQAPSQAQRDAIKSQCRSDYIAHCSSIPPGGEASLQCLQSRRPNPRQPRRLHRKRSRLRPLQPPRRKPQRPRPRRARRRSSRAARRFPPSAAPAAPTIQKSARGCRPAARRLCSAWRRTNQSCRQPARRRSPQPAARLLQRQQPLRQPQRRRRRPSSCCGRCGRASNCSSCGRHAAATSARFAAAWRPAAAVSCNAWRRRQPPCRPRARTSWPGFPRNRLRALPAILPKSSGIAGDPIPARDTTNCDLERKNRCYAPS